MLPEFDIEKSKSAPVRKATMTGACLKLLNGAQYEAPTFGGHGSLILTMLPDCWYPVITTACPMLADG